MPFHLISQVKFLHMEVRILVVAIMKNWHGMVKLPGLNQVERI